MSLADLFREKWRRMRAERARGEESRRRVIESLSFQQNDRFIRRFADWWETTPIEKFLEDIAFLLKNAALLDIINLVAGITIIISLVTWLLTGKQRRDAEVYQAWQVITAAHGQSGSGGRRKALESLNSRPWRFPWIGWTGEGWFWDEDDEKCKKKRLLGFRWEREPLVGLSAPNAYLAGIHLCGADLIHANLGGADLKGADLQGANLVLADLKRANLRRANLQKANLVYANLQGAALSYADLKKADLGSANLKGVSLWKVNLAPKQIKSTCFWEEAVYTSLTRWNETERKWIAVDEKANQKIIEEIKRDKASEPKNPPYCSRWK